MSGWMKIRNLIVILWGMMISFGVWAERPLLKLVAPDYSPYYGPDLSGKGFVSQLVTEVMQQAGYDVSIQFLPWKRAVEHVKLGDADGLYTVWFREDRKTWAVFSKPLYYDEIVFLKKRKLIIDYNGLDDLTPFLISDVLGYMYPESYQNAALKKKNSMNDQEAIKRMVLGGADLALADKIQAQFLLREMGEDMEKYDFLNPPLERVGSHLIISTLRGDADQIIAKFDAAMGGVKASGRAEEIVRAAGFSSIGLE